MHLRASFWLVVSRDVAASARANVCRAPLRARDEPASSGAAPRLKLARQIVPRVPPVSILDVSDSEQTARSPARLHTCIAVLVGAMAACSEGAPSAGACTPGKWCQLSSARAPTERSDFVEVWAGTRLLVWGGSHLGSAVDDGAAWNASSDSWTPLAGASAPLARSGAGAAWDGAQLLVFGGTNDNQDVLGDGATYDPAADRWAPVSAANAPSARSSPVVVWTGTAFLVWGGDGPSGAAFDGAILEQGTWRPVSATGAPISSLFGSSAAWTGERLIVWSSPGSFSSGLYDPGANAWSPIATAGAPSSRIGSSLVWTGTRAIVWGGFSGLSGGDLSDGALYDPRTDQWSAMSSTGAPSPRSQHAAVWTGTQMIVYGGQTGDGRSLADGAIYDPVTDTWIPLPGGAGIVNGAMAAWTGSELVVCGSPEAAVQSTPLPCYRIQP